jgi:hypothetical protein
MNFPVALFALLAARQANDSPADAGRIALVSMVAKPPILGLLLAVAMANRAAPAQAVLATNTTNTTNALHGAAVYSQVAPETDLHSFLPSFISYTRNQAAEFAKELRLNVQFVEEGSNGHRVVRQDPRAGADWPSKREVTLYLD